MTATGYTTKEDEAVQALVAIGIQASAKTIRGVCFVSSSCFLSLTPHALDVLRKHNGDLDATASALMSELDDPQVPERLPNLVVMFGI